MDRNTHEPPGPPDSEPWWARPLDADAPPAFPPPEPAFATTAPSPAYDAPGYGAAPAWPPPPAPGTAYPGGAQYGYGHGYVYGMPVAPQLDKGARTSLILGIVSLLLCGPLLGPAAIYEGARARGRIRRSYGQLTGDGLALAGIIVGSISTVVTALYLLVIVVAGSV